MKDEVLADLGTSMEAISQGAQPIAKCECLMLPVTLEAEAERLRGRNITWYVDNTAALSGIVKGTSREATNRQIIAWFWILAFRLDIRIWLEYVDSESNWSDGISREFGKDKFAKDNCFSTGELHPDLRWLHADVDELWARSVPWERQRRGPTVQRGDRDPERKV